MIDRIAESFEGNREAAQHALDSVVDGITRSLEAGEKVAIKGFGVFRQSKEQTEEKGEKAKRSVLQFDPNKELRDVVAGVKKARNRALESLAQVPAQAAHAAEVASRAASSAARAAAGVVRGEDEVAPTESASDAPPPAKKSTAKKSTAKKSPAKKSPAKKAAAEKPPAKKSTAKKSPAKKSAAKKTPAADSASEAAAPAKKSAAKTSPAKKTTAKKSAAKKAPAKKSPAKKSAAKKTTPAETPPASPAQGQASASPGDERT
nr:histone H1-like repetitive region-containing protein [Phytoactinopolyspora mesophila]